MLNTLTWIMTWVHGGRQCYLDQLVSRGGRAGAEVLWRNLFLLGSLQEILGRSRPSWTPCWLGPLQGTVELLGQSQACVRLWVQLFVTQSCNFVWRLTLSVEFCFRVEILKGLWLELRRSASGGAEWLNQKEKRGKSCNDNIISNQDLGIIFKGPIVYPLSDRYQ